jgi:hypothetical protein
MIFLYGGAPHPRPDRFFRIPGQPGRILSDLLSSYIPAFGSNADQNDQGDFAPQIFTNCIALVFGLQGFRISDR